LLNISFFEIIWPMSFQGAELPEAHPEAITERPVLSLVEDIKTGDAGDLRGS
jgi:hypothetical protein